jgi:hypothetical protein
MQFKAFEEGIEVNGQNGKSLYDETTNNIHEGIGHYGYERVPGKNLILSLSNNPYPCVF